MGEGDREEKQGSLII
uniref:Uncharacterized protein n=1 Tax=Rhizophora mucronata TaxID=61149 RepID=A0A2P2P8N0_RHIMU